MLQGGACHVEDNTGSRVAKATQRPYECGSHQCGQNTSAHLTYYGDGIWAVMLDKHGPNIVFNRSADPQKVIKFIEENFDLAGRTDDVTMPIPDEFKNARSSRVQLST